ncbi:calponin homology domain-containing protein, partial [Paraphysoderma sedebokerense]
AESRVELLAWLNNLLQLNYTKIEQLGTGPYCQIIDSIYGDVAMQKVKFDAKHEYEYVANYKVLQLAFNNHRIDKVIPVQRLLKCKFQDNIEFMQWMKKYHDTHFPGGHYDALSRRKSTGGRMSKTSNSKLSSSTSSSRPSRSTSTITSPKSPSASATASRQVQELTKELEELKATMSGLETERDFYFGKLRDIEIIIQTKNTSTPPELLSPELRDFMKEMTDILYSTEEGFEVPETEGVEGVADLTVVPGNIVGGVNAALEGAVEGLSGLNVGADMGNGTGMMMGAEQDDLETF